jgi:hypothetical protein
LKSKSFIKTVLPIIFATVLLSAFATAAIMHTITIPSTITILPPDPDADYEIKAYTDQECTQELTQLDFGNTRAGTSKQVTFYVKNTGTANVTLSPTQSPVIGSCSWGWTNLNTTEPQGALRPNDIAEFRISLSIPAEATAEVKEFDLLIRAVA